MVQTENPQQLVSSAEGLGSRVHGLGLQNCRVQSESYYWVCAYMLCQPGYIGSWFQSHSRGLVGVLPRMMVTDEDDDGESNFTDDRNDDDAATDGSAW